MLRARRPVHFGMCSERQCSGLRSDWENATTSRGRLISPFRFAINTEATSWISTAHLLPVGWLWRTRPGTQAMPVSNASFEAAVSLHRQGHLSEAEGLYENQLRTVPNHVQALHNLALLRAQQGRFDDADALLRRALRVKPNAAELHNIRGQILCTAKRYTEASMAFGRAISLKSDYAEANNNKGIALHAMGRVDDAIRCFERAVSINPGYADAQHNLGGALRSLGRNEEALEHLNQALVRSGPQVATHRLIADALQDLQRPSEAIDHYVAALVNGSEDAELYYNFGTALLTLNRYQEALVNYRRAISLKPDYAEAHDNLGAVLMGLERPLEALASFDEALRLRPAKAETHSNRGEALLLLKRTEEAIVAFEQALDILPDHAISHNNIGTALRDLGRYEEAIAHFEAALKLQSGYGQVYSNLDATLREAGRASEVTAVYDRARTAGASVGALYYQIGHLASELGNIAPAREALEHAVDLEPKNAGYYFALSDVKKFTKSDRHFAGADALAKEIESLSPDDQLRLHFAMGKILADVGEYEQSFRHQILGNALKRQTFTYEEAGIFSEFDRIPAVFTKELIRSMNGRGDLSPLPVFIVGMPRSGTTLIEQILASHPQVFGAGELDHFGRLAHALSAGGQLPSEQVRLLGSQYISAIRSLAPETDRITDKMPGNFRFVGLIHIALPNARIIHARRNPLDTCLSCFSKLFGGEQQFAYDLAELGRFYRAYEGLMAHWRSILPEGAMLEVDYEEVIADLEVQARRIISYCGLEWNDACLEFHKTERAVRTASVMQVRQPIYRSSIGRWRPYAHLLTPLLDALGIDPVTAAV